MAGENVERLQLAFEAFARGDIDALAENIDSDFQIEASILGDQILVRVRLEGEGRTTSLAMEQLNPDRDIGHRWTLRDGRALSLKIYRTWGEARAAAGMQG
jgi:hypothetical protein